MPPETILTGRKDEFRAVPSSDPSTGRAIWAWVGLAFLIVGGTDLLLTWFPLKFGNQAWEFGSTTSALNGLPVPVLGLAAMLWAAGEGRRRWLAGLALAAATLMLLGILVALVLWATGIPLALRSVPGQLGVGLKRALVKTSIQAVVYPVLLVVMIVRSWRLVRRSA
jgi:hypothetical protein